jgi:lysophospholipase L1-like esterase
VLTKLARWLRDGLIMLAIALGLLGLLELGLRLYMGPPGYQFDEVRIASLAPNASKIYLRWVDGGPRFVHWQTNAEGFRGPELEESPRWRVMVYGDSNVQARFSVQDETFTGQIRRFLEASGRTGVEVINSGVVGYGPDQSLLRLEAEVDPYAPDAIVLHIFTENDFGDIVRNRLFELDEMGRLVRSPHPVTVDARMPVSAWSRPPGELLSNSMLSLFANAFVQGRSRAKTPHPELVHDPEAFRENALRQHEREFAVYRARAPREYSMFSDHYEADIAFAPELESSQTKRKLLAAVLERASRVAKAHGIPFLVVIQPNSRDLTTNLANHYQALADVPGYDRRRLDRWVTEISEEAGIESINLFDRFESEEDPNELYFPTPDPHWNEAGERVAAQAVAEWLDASLR